MKSKRKKDADTLTIIIVVFIVSMYICINLFGIPNE